MVHGGDVMAECHWARWGHKGAPVSAKDHYWWLHLWGPGHSILELEHRLVISSLMVGENSVSALGSKLRFDGACSWSAISWSLKCHNLGGLSSQSSSLLYNEISLRRIPILLDFLSEHCPKAGPRSCHLPKQPFSDSLSSVVFQLQKPQRESVCGLAVSENAPGATAIDGPEGQRRVEGQGAGVRDRRSENERVYWGEKWSEERGWQRGWTLKEGREKSGKWFL